MQPSSQGENVNSIQYRSKVSWHSILDPRKNQVENQDSILNYCFLWGMIV